MSVKKVVPKVSNGQKDAVAVILRKVEAMTIKNTAAAAASDKAHTKVAVSSAEPELHKRLREVWKRQRYGCQEEVTRNLIEELAFAITGKKLSLLSSSSSSSRSAPMTFPTSFILVVPGKDNGKYTKGLPALAMADGTAIGGSGVKGGKLNGDFYYASEEQIKAWFTKIIAKLSVKASALMVNEYMLQGK